MLKPLLGSENELVDLTYLTYLDIILLVSLLQRCRWLNICTQPFVLRTMRACFILFSICFIMQFMYSSEHNVVITLARVIFASVSLWFCMTRPWRRTTYITAGVGNHTRSFRGSRHRGALSWSLRKVPLANECNDTINKQKKYALQNFCAVGSLALWEYIELVNIITLCWVQLVLDS